MKISWLLLLVSTVAVGQTGQTLCPVGGGRCISADTDARVTVVREHTRVERLTDAEVAKLEALRKALADAEKAIAEAHGVDVKGNTDTACSASYATTGLFSGSCATWTNGPYRNPDQWEIRGRFLLVNLPAKEK